VSPVTRSTISWFELGERATEQDVVKCLQGLKKLRWVVRISHLSGMSISSYNPVLLLFLVGVITFQLFSGESLGIVRRREDQPRAYWTILAVQVASIVLLLFCTTCIRARARSLTQL